jgi:hypothetical protein
MADTYDIFISYCRKDIAKAKRIKEDTRETLRPHEQTAP